MVLALQQKRSPESSPEGRQIEHADTNPSKTRERDAYRRQIERPQQLAIHRLQFAPSARLARSPAARRNTKHRSIRLDGDLKPGVNRDRRNGRADIPGVYDPAERNPT